MGAARTVLAGLAAWRGAATDPAARAARLALEAIDAYGAVAVAAAAPPRNASAVYAKAPAAAAPLAAMAAEAARWADEAIAARDPVHVRDRLGMKGCKHFAEYLDLQRLAAELGDGAARARALRAVERAAAAEAYHAFLGQREASARWREDSMSYLRALYLSGELGAPGPLLAAWRARAAAAMPAFWRHVAGRGVDQRLNFAKLFRGLGLAAEADLVAFERATRRATPSRGAGPSRGSSSPRTGPTTCARGLRADARRPRAVPRGRGPGRRPRGRRAALGPRVRAPHGRGAAQGLRAPRRAGRRVRAAGEPGPARRAPAAAAAAALPSGRGPWRRGATPTAPSARPTTPRASARRRGSPPTTSRSAARSTRPSCASGPSPSGPGAGWTSRDRRKLSRRRPSRRT